MGPPFSIPNLKFKNGFPIGFKPPPKGPKVNPFWGLKPVA